MLQFDRNGYEFATLARRAWLYERFGEPEQANYIWDMFFKAFYVTLQQMGERGYIQRKAIQIASKFNKGFSTVTWYSKSKKRRTQGDNFYKATHGDLGIDPVAIWCAEGAVASMRLDFETYAADNKGCPIATICADDVTNYRVFLWFVIKAAVEYNKDIRREQQIEVLTKKYAKKKKRYKPMPTTEADIAQEVKKQYKASINELLKACDEAEIKAWAHRIANNKKGRPAAGESKKEQWWVIAGLPERTARYKSDSVANKIDLKFSESKIDGTDSILSEVKVEMAMELAK